MKQSQLLFVLTACHGFVAPLVGKNHDLERETEGIFQREITHPCEALKSCNVHFVMLEGSTIFRTCYRGYVRIGKFFYTVGNFYNVTLVM